MCFSPLCVSCADWVKFSTMTMQFFANRWKNHWVQRGCFPPQYLIINFTKEKTLMSIKFLISHVFYWRLCVRCFVLVKTPYQVHAKKILTNLRSSICKRLMVNNTCRKKFIQSIKTTIKKTNMSWNANFCKRHWIQSWRNTLVSFIKLLVQPFFFLFLVSIQVQE